MTNPMIRFVLQFFQAVVVWLLMAAVAYPMWEESQSEQIPREVQSPKKNEPVSPSVQNVKARQKRDVSIGFLLLAVIGIVAATFAVMVVMWGSQVRRIVRKQISKRTPEDPLWYLKPNKTQETQEKMDSETPTPNLRNNDLESS
jgi:hypothetical protein